MLHIPNFGILSNLMRVGPTVPFKHSKCAHTRVCVCVYVCVVKGKAACYIVPVCGCVISRVVSERSPETWFQMPVRHSQAH